MSGPSQNPTAQNNVKITSLHTLLCRFQGVQSWSWHYFVLWDSG